MKLSDLVRLRNNLQDVSTTAVRATVNTLDGKLTHINELPMHLGYRDNVESLIHSIDSIESQLDNLNNNIPVLVEAINREIVERTKEFMARGYIINGFYGSNSTDVTTERNHRIMNMHDETRSAVLVRARKYTDWRYPVLEIGPGDGTWTEHLIAGDPLYIIDVHQEFLDSTLSKFNPMYRNRIRSYLTGMHANRSDTDLSMLPTEQFGFIFAWNVFDYFPLAHTKAFLEQSIHLLRPGGHMMFSYNNCDFVQCAEYAEQGFRSWMPQSLLINTCNELGFEVVNLSSLEETVHWIEIKKPGELKTVKAHQVMGEIVSL